MMACPWCEGTRGYYRTQQVKRLARNAWDGLVLADSDAVVFYEGKTLRCLDCGENVTSFVRGLAREKESQNTLAK